jgi:hypothetical protein
MSIRLRLGDEVFDIPTVGASNWGEQITLYLRKNSEIIATIQGPQDILLTEAPLSNGASSQPINGLSFDTASVQQIVVDGIITRNFLTGTPTVDSFVCEGVFDGADFYIDTTFTGTDAKVKLDINAAGQFIYTAEDVTDTNSISIKFRARAIIDE